MTRELTEAIEDRDLARARAIAAQTSPTDLTGWLGRRPAEDQAVLFRLLPKDEALEVFESMSSSAQAGLVQRLADDEVTAVFAELDPDDRASLMDELPAKVARKLLHELTQDERDLTSVVLGYPERSVGRRMSPEVIAVSAHETVQAALARVRRHAAEAETIYTLPVVADGRVVVGVVGLRDLLIAPEDTVVGDIAVPADLAYATEPVEDVARLAATRGRLALPVVDSEERLVGIFTVDDALIVLEDAAAEDQARQGGSEPLRAPYLATPIWRIVKSRVVWLLVLAIGATLTVQVLEQFESTLSQMVVLSVFIPLIIGTGGNTGNQAATTVTRALAVGDVSPRDVLRIMARECVIGLSLGAVLGTIGFLLITVVYGADLGQVIGLTLLVVCTIAAVAGGVIPLLARKLGTDPAVFSNPFISTLLDATGLVVYFVIAVVLLGL